MKRKLFNPKGDNTMFTKIKNVAQNEQVRQVAKAVAISVAVGLTTQLVINGVMYAGGKLIDGHFKKETGIDEAPSVE